MQIQKRFNIPKRKLIITAVVMALITTGVLGYAWYTYHASVSTSSDTSQQLKDAANSSDKNNPQTKQGTPAVDGVNKDTTTDKVPVSLETTVAITQLSQQNGIVTYGAEVTNPGGIGTCSAVFASKISRPVTHDERITNGICGPTSIPETEFSSTGEWTLTLRYFSDNLQAVTTKTIQIK